MSLQDKYTAAARVIYDQIVDWYVDSFWADDIDLDWLKMFVDKMPPGARICDMASGPGNFAQHLDPTRNFVTCVDVSPRMIEAAKKLVPSVRGIVADMRQVPLEDGAFDALLCAYSLNHIVKEEVDTVLAEFSRLVVPGGVVGLMLKEGEGRYEFTSRPLPNVKCIMELWQVDELCERLGNHRLDAREVYRKQETNSHEFDHAKMFVIGVKQSE